MDLEIQQLPELGVNLVNLDRGIIADVEIFGVLPNKQREIGREVEVLKLFIELVDRVDLNTEVNICVRLQIEDSIKNDVFEQTDGVIHVDDNIMRSLMASNSFVDFYDDSFTVVVDLAT